MTDEKGKEACSEKVVYLHIGYGKTGTSSIQDMMFDNRVYFKTIGLLYPELGLWKTAHHNLSLLEGEPDNSLLIKQHLVNINAEFIDNGYQKLVLSSERLCFTIPGIIELYRDVFKDSKIQIIMYIRRQEDLIPSVYLEWMKNGWDYKGDLEAFFAHTRAAYDFINILKGWESAFGEGSIKIKLYCKKLMANICDSFLDAIEVARPCERFTSHHSNPSLSASLAKTIRLLDASKINVDLRKDIISNLVEVSGHITVDGYDSIINKDLKRKIREEYFNSNEELARRYLSDEEKYLLMDYN